MTQLAKKTFFGKNKNTSGVVGRTPQRPTCSLGKSVTLLGESPLGLVFGSKLPEKASGLAWTYGTVCVCAQRPPIGTSQQVWAARRALFLPQQEGAE